MKKRKNIFINLLFPIDGEWSAWGEYSSCTKTCGTGQKSRSRTCSNPAPSNGGSNCKGSSFESIVCNTDACSAISSPINGHWSEWGEYSSCTQTCGTGSKSRTRTCTNPAPSGGGSKCVGSSSETADCNSNTCPGT